MILDYRLHITNKPKINGVVLDGDKTGSDYHVVNNKTIILSSGSIAPLDGYKYIVPNGLSSITIGPFNKNHTFEIFVESCPSNFSISSSSDAINFIGDDCSGGHFSPQTSHKYYIGVGYSGDDLYVSVVNPELYKI